MTRGGKSQKVSKQPGQPKCAGPKGIIEHIKSITPPITKLPISLHVSETQTLSAIEHLQCSVCMEVLSQPVELPCRALVCISCVVNWLTVSASSQCPCCFSESPLTSTSIHPAPSLILKLVGDILVCCPACKVEVKVGTYDMHQCTPQAKSSSKDDLQVTSSVIQQLLSESPENIVEIPTRGTVSYIYCVLHNLSHTVCSH